MRERLNELWLRVKAIGKAKQLDRDLEDEMAFHLAMREQAYRDAGVPEATAQQMARRQFGNTLRVTESLREMWGWGAIDRAWQDLKFGIRLARRQPAFTAVVIATLALGIGAATTMFTIVDAVMLRPLDVPQAERLVIVWETNQERSIQQFTGSAANYLDWRAGATSFAELGAWEERTDNRSDGPQAEQVRGAVASSSFFRALGVQPVLGRWYRDDEDTPSGRFVAVLGHDYWRRQFGGDRSAIGRSITLNGEPHEVIGVMPPLRAPFAADIWHPLAADAAALDRGDHNVLVIGRLAPGSDAERAQAELQSIAAGLAASYPDTNKGWSIRLEALHDAVVPGSTQDAMLVLMGAVGLLLLIACVNVANLMLARGTGRQREITTRLALGATRARVVRQLVAEAAVLAGLGGAAGLLVAAWSLQLAEWVYAEQHPALTGMELNGYALAFAVAVSAAATFVVGILPALRLSRTGGDGGAMQLTRAVSDTPKARRLRHGLVVAEVALALTLLVGAGLLLRSVDRLKDEPLGFSPDGVLTAKIGLYSEKYNSLPAYTGFIDQLLADLEQRPQISAAGVSSSVPFGGGYTSMQTRVPGSTPEAERGVQAGWRVIGGDYFAAMGIPLRSGRPFDAGDNRQRPVRTAIISEVLAEALWPGQDPIGRQMLVSDSRRPYEIVGVTGPSRLTELGRDPEPVMYFHYRQFPWASLTLVTRTAGDPAALERTVRGAVAAIDREQPVADVRVMTELVSRAAATPQMNASLLALFSVAALTLAAIGVYGVMSYSAAQRTTEVGVRLALGARPLEMLTMVLLDGLRLGGAGLALGLAGALLLGRSMSALLYRVSMVDPLTYGATFAMMLAITLVACYLPARRAMQTDASVALRHE
jgi:putative ABC transport system permease protein